jgi:hypothetical protein
LSWIDDEIIDVEWRTMGPAFVAFNCKEDDDDHVRPGPVTREFCEVSAEDVCCHRSNATERQIVQQYSFVMVDLEAHSSDDDDDDDGCWCAGCILAAVLLKT